MAKKDGIGYSKIDETKRVDLEARLKVLNKERDELADKLGEVSNLEVTLSNSVHISDKYEQVMNVLEGSVHSPYTVEKESYGVAPSFNIFETTSESKEYLFGLFKITNHFRRKICELAIAEEKKNSGGPKISDSWEIGVYGEMNVPYAKEIASVLIKKFKTPVNITLENRQNEDMEDYVPEE